METRCISRLQIKKGLIFLNPDSLPLVALTALYSTVSYVQWSSNCTSTWCTCCIVRMACMSPQGERGFPSGVCCRVELRRGITPRPPWGGEWLFDVFPLCSKALDNAAHAAFMSVKQSQASSLGIRMRDDSFVEVWRRWTSKPAVTRKDITNFGLALLIDR